MYSNVGMCCAPYKYRVGILYGTQRTSLEDIVELSIDHKKYLIIQLVQVPASLYCLTFKETLKMICVFFSPTIYLVLYVDLLGTINY